MTGLQERAQLTDVVDCLNVGLRRQQCAKAGAEDLVVIDDEHSPGHGGIVPRLRSADYASAAQTASNTDMFPSTNASRNGCCPARKSSEPSAPSTIRPVLRRTFWCVTGSV